MTNQATQEKRLRFGCGFIFGLGAGAASFGLVFYDNGMAIVVLSAVAAFVCGLAAMRYGSVFWRVIKNLWFW